MSNLQIGTIVTANYGAMSPTYECLVVDIAKNCITIANYAGIEFTTNEIQPTFKRAPGKSPIGVFFGTEEENAC
jgi:hypothetical protein